MVTDSIVVAVTGAGSASIADQVTADDQVTVSVTAARGLADVAAVADSIVATLTGQLALDDGAAVSDQVGTVTVSARSIEDGLAVVDVVSVILTGPQLVDTPPARRLTVQVRHRGALHDPDGRLDWRWDWAAELPGDRITDAAVTSADPLIVIEDVAHDDGSVVAWVTGGSVGTTAAVRCRVVTESGRVDERTIWLHIRQR